MISRGFVPEEIMSKADLVMMDEEFIEILAVDAGHYLAICAGLEAKKHLLVIHTTEEGEYTVGMYGSDAEAVRSIEEDDDPGWTLHKVFDLKQKKPLVVTLETKVCIGGKPVSQEDRSTWCFHIIGCGEGCDYSPAGCNQKTFFEGPLTEDEARQRASELYENHGGRGRIDHVSIRRCSDRAHTVVCDSQCGL